MNNQTKQCPTCHNQIKAEAQVCRYCGATFEVVVRGTCAQCRSQVEADDNGLCSQCGGPLTEVSVESQPLAAGVVAPATSRPPARSAAPAHRPGPPTPILALQPAQQEAEQEIEVWPRKGEGVGNRFAALLIDWIAITLISSIMMALAYAGTSSTSKDIQAFVSSSAILIVPVVWFLYFTVQEGAFGTTFGKKFGVRPQASLRVIRLDGSPPGFGRAALRALLSPLEANLIGALVTWLTPRHQRIADLLAGTMVINAWKIHKISFTKTSAAFEFLDGRQAAIGKLFRGNIQKWGAMNVMRLDGASPDGQRVRLYNLIYPNQRVRQQVREALELHFQTVIEEYVQWWRLGVALGTVMIGGVCIVGVLAIISISSSSSRSGLASWLSTRLPGPTPTAIRLSVDSLGSAYIQKRVSVEGILSLPRDLQCNDSGSQAVCNLSLRTTGGDDVPLWVLETMIRYSIGGTAVQALNGNLALDESQVRVTGIVLNCPEGTCVGIQVDGIDLIK